jgi:hypothetical protein
VLDKASILNSAAPIVSTILAACGQVSQPAVNNVWAEFKGIVSSAGFSPEVPPSTVPRPGYVFIVLKDTSGKEFRRTICSDWSNGVKPKEDALVIPGLVTSKDLSADLGISLAQQLLQGRGDASVNAAATRITKVIFKPQYPRAWEMSDPPLEGRSTRQVPAGCIGGFQRIQGSDGKFTTPVYVVVNSMSYDGFSFTFEGSGGPDVALKLAATGIGSANAGLTAKSTTQGTMEVAPVPGQIIYVGTHIVEAIEMGTLSNIGASAADFTFANVSKEQNDRVSSVPFEP